MRSQPAAKTGSIGIRFTHTETPGGLVLGHGASQIGVFLQMLSDVVSFAAFERSFWRHFDSPLCYLRAESISVSAQPLPCVRISPAISTSNRKHGWKFTLFHDFFIKMIRRLPEVGLIHLVVAELSVTAGYLLRQDHRGLDLREGLRQDHGGLDLQEQAPSRARWA